MKAVFLRASLLLLSCSLAGCATGGGEAREQGGTDVTRVHLGQPVARGQIAIEAYDAADANLPEFRSYAGSVQRQLARLGWTVVSTLGQSEQIALVDVEQGSRAALEARGMRIGAGAAGGSAGASERWRPCWKSASRGARTAPSSGKGGRFPMMAETVSPPSKSFRMPFFGTSLAIRGALSGRDEPLHFERLRWRQHSPGRHRGQPRRP
jgi:hypothetical protein